MSGVKGRSGRRKKLEEMQSKDLASVCKGHLLMRMQDPSTPIDIKDKIALCVAPRLIPNANELHITAGTSDNDRLVLGRYMPQAIDNQADVVDSE